MGSNGTYGRVFTEELRSDDRTPQQRADDEARFAQALARDRFCNGPYGWADPSCGNLEKALSNYKVTAVGEVDVGDSSASAEWDPNTGEVSADGSIPTGIPGQSVSTSGGGVTQSVGGAPFRAKAGLCVAKKKAGAEPAHGASAEVMGGNFWGSADTAGKACLGIQTTTAPGGSVTVK